MHIFATQTQRLPYPDPGEQQQLQRVRASNDVEGVSQNFHAQVHSPEQLRAVNALCRYVDEAVEIRR